MYVVYKHTNTVSGKCYIGKTKWSIERRWRSHVGAALKGGQLHLHFAIRKYPLDSWVHEILETTETIEEANLHEIKWIASCQSNDPARGYNMTKGGDGGQTCSFERLSQISMGRPKSEEHKRKIREANQRYWASNPDDPRRQQLIERNKTDEARRLSSEAQQRRWAKR